MEHPIDAEETQAAASQPLSSYSPTPYVDQQWAVLSDPEAKHGFEPLEVVAIAAAAHQVDPMFEDFTSQVGYQLCIDTRSSQRRFKLGGGAEQVEEHEYLQGSEAQGNSDANTVAAKAPSIDQDEHERALTEAREAAFREAREATQLEANVRIEAIETQLAATVEDLKTQVAEAIGAAEEKAAELALSVARKLMGAAVETTPDYFKTIIKEAIAAAGNADIRRIKVSPRDYEALKNIPPGDRGAASGDGWTFEPDESIHIGCVVVTAAGEVDFNLDKAWERIRKQVLSPAGASDE